MQTTKVTMRNGGVITDADGNVYKCSEHGDVLTLIDNVNSMLAQYGLELRVGDTKDGSHWTCVAQKENIAQALSRVLYEKEASILHFLAPDEVTVKRLTEWVESTKEMVQDGEEDMFTLDELQQMSRHIPEIVECIRRW